jgi:hypothetical protein
MQRETFIIGEKEFAASKIAPFQANTIAMKLQKIAMPAIAAMVSGGMGADISGALKELSQNLDEKTLTDVILPMFKAASVASITDNTKIETPEHINKVFVDADGLADLYELIYEVTMYNFQPFFTKLASRFGLNVTRQSQTDSTTAELAS